MKCKSFAVDLMHLSTNEINEIKDLPALKAHLKQCLACQDKLNKLRGADVFSFLAKPRSAKYQRKMTALLGQVKAETDRLVPPLEPIPGEKSIDDERVVGSAAGKIYRVLKTNGKTPYPVVRKETGLAGFPFYESMGWLLKEKKVQLSEDKQTIYATLTEQERQQAGV